MLDTSMGKRAQTEVAQGSVLITLKSQYPTTRQSSFEMSARQKFQFANIKNRPRCSALSHLDAARTPSDRDRW